MTKQEITDKYYFFARKRDEYSSKIERNNQLRQKIYEGMYDCNDGMNDILNYNDKADIFGTLYLRNYNRFCIAEINEIDGIFAEIDTHLQRVKNESQKSVNYWYHEMINYKEEEVEEEE